MLYFDHVNFYKEFNQARRIQVPSTEVGLYTLLEDNPESQIWVRPIDQALMIVRIDLDDNGNQEKITEFLYQGSYLITWK